MDAQPSFTALVDAQRRWFMTGATLPAETRLSALAALHTEIRVREEQILDALHTDLGKSPAEAYLTEIGLVLGPVNTI